MCTWLLVMGPILGSVIRHIIISLNRSSVNILDPGSISNILGLAASDILGALGARLGHVTGTF